MEIQSKATVTIPKNGRVITDADQYEESMTDLDDFDLAKLFKPHIDMGLSQFQHQKWSSLSMAC